MKSSTLVSLAILSLAATPALRADQWTGRWSQTLDWPIIPIHATMLPNGKIFTFGTDPNGTQQAYNYDIFTPGYGQFADNHQTIWHNQGTDIFCSATSLMPNGNVLVPGGDTRNPVNVGIKDTLMLNGANNQMTRAPYMQFARWYPTLITLPNGEQLIQGGREWDGQPINTPEIFNGQNWRPLWGATNGVINDNAEGKWFYPRSWVAPNGRVFGMTGNQMYFMDVGGDGAVQLAGNLPNKTRSHISTAVMYRPGQIFQAGGSVFGDTQAEGSRQAITVDINSGNPVVQNLPDMAYRRVWANSTVLANGEVFVNGGSAFENKDIDAAKMAEMWNPNTRQFRQLKPATHVRMYHSVSLLLPDGSVLTGGGGAPGPYVQKNAEIYWPPYLFQGGDWAPRPTTGNFNLAQKYGNVVNVPTGGAGGIARVTLVRTGAVTHSFDSSQRFIELGFQKLNGSINVNMPNSANIAPPGYYMLFVINDAGVPSVAKIVSLNQNNPGTGGVVAGPKVGSVYSLVARHSNKCVDVAGSNVNRGANVQQYTCNNTNAQKFRLENTANGALRLVNVNSNKCVDVAGGRIENGTNIQQWDCNGLTPQAFRLEASANGSYKLRFENSKRCLDVSAVGLGDGQNIHQWDCIGGAANQDFTFRP